MIDSQTGKLIDNKIQTKLVLQKVYDEAFEKNIRLDLDISLVRMESLVNPEDKALTADLAKVQRMQEQMKTILNMIEKRLEELN